MTTATIWARTVLRTLPFASLALLLAGPADANLVLSQVILDLTPGTPAAQDIEVWNNGTDRSYVVAEPAEVILPGQPGEHRVANPDPAVSGLLVTPQRMILEPGQRRLVRIAAVLPRGDAERVYRIEVKPVAGEVTAGATALKVMVGYDVLVIFRPQTLRGDIVATRAGTTVTFRNTGNTNVEMFEGKQCDAAGKACKDLPANRVYPGMQWNVPIDPARPVQYRIATGTQSVVKTF